MKNVLAILLAADFAAHSALSYGVSLTTALAAQKYLSLSSSQSAYVGFLAALALGIMKEEMVDKRRDLKDYGADVLGCVLGAGVSIVF